jgi:hypothetical protein
MRGFSWQSAGLFWLAYFALFGGALALAFGWPFG